MSRSPTAVFTFFSRTTCGHCKHFKGESTDAKGRSIIDPNSGWEVLTAERELQDLGVEFQLYQFGPEKDPETGVVKNYVLDDEYVSRVKGIPRLELSVPDDPHNFVEFSDPELRGWNADQSVPIIKRWIIKTLKQEPFKSWRPKAKVARPPEVIMPHHRHQPVQPPTIVKQAAPPQPSMPIQAPAVAVNPTPAFHPNPRQQVLANRGIRPSVVRTQPTMVTPPAMVQRQVMVEKQAEPEEEEEVESLQEEEPESDEEPSADEKSPEASQEEEEEVKEVQSHRPVMPPPQRRPVQRQPIVKNSRSPMGAPSARPMATQPVHTPSPRQMVQMAQPVVHTPPPVQAAPVEQSQPKTRFLPSNWDV